MPVDVEGLGFIVLTRNAANDFRTILHDMGWPDPDWPEERIRGRIMSRMGHAKTISRILRPYGFSVVMRIDLDADTNLDLVINHDSSQMAPNGGRISFIQRVYLPGGVK